jgi:hypothetical protein
MIRQGLIPITLPALWLSASLWADSIAVNFVGGSQANGLDGGRFTAEEAAGAPGWEQNNWNQIKGRFPNDPLAQPAGDDPGKLKDSNGTPTQASVLWTVEKTNRILSYPQTANDRMRRGYLDTTDMFEKKVEVVVENIPYSQYDLVVYVGSEFYGSRGSVQVNGEKTYYRNADVKAGGAPNSSVWDPYLEATAKILNSAQRSSHVIVRGLNARQITFVVQAEGTRNSGVHGFQIRKTK